MKSETKVYKMERRTFLQLSAAAVLVGGLIDIDAAHAANDCKLVQPGADLSVIPGNGTYTVPSGNEVLFWIDGPMNSTLKGYETVAATARLMTRARISCVIDIENMEIRAADYIESVSLVEKVGTARSLIQRFFYGPTPVTKTGRQPYTIFENVNINPANEYELIFVRVQMDNSGNSSVYYYRHIITNPEPSRFDYNHILAMDTTSRTAQFVPFILDEIRETNKYKKKENDNPAAKFNADGKLQKSGYITTPYGTSFDHTCSAKVVSIAADGGDFAIEIDFMHGDAGADHYMRYFLVTDPVGRVLGGVRRLQDTVSGTSYYDTAGLLQKVLVKKGFHTPEFSRAGSQYCNTSGADLRSVNNSSWPSYTHKIGSNSVKYGRLCGQYVVRDPNAAANLTPADAGYFIAYDIPSDETSFTRYNRVNILDCPHINIYTDDRHHAIAKACLRLR